MPDGRSITQLLNELNEYRRATGEPPITKEQVPSGSAGFDYLDRRIEQARSRWETTLPWWQRSLAQFGLGGPRVEAAGLRPGVAEKAAGFTAQRAAAEAAGVELAPTPTVPTPTGLEEVEIPPYPTEPPPTGFRWEWDREAASWVPQFAGQEELARQQLELQRRQVTGFPAPTTPFRGGVPMAGVAAGAARGPTAVEPPTDPFGRTATWSARLGEWDYPPNWGQRPADQPAPISPFQEEQFGFQEQQFRAQQQQFQQQQEQAQAQFQAQLEFQQAQLQAAQEEQQRQYGAQLAAQPINWLQYAAYTGEEPVVQPWMIPLGFQETGGAVTPQGQIGQPIPGFQAQAGQQGIQTFGGLPQLGTPSAQLQARWGPTAQAQFLGYRQARTGAAPEETQFRLGAGRAPTGAFGGFSRFR